MGNFKLTILTDSNQQGMTKGLKILKNYFIFQDMLREIISGASLSRALWILQEDLDMRNWLLKQDGKGLTPQKYIFTTSSLLLESKVFMSRFLLLNE